MLRILIYGDKQDKDVLIAMLENAEPIYFRQKEYVYCTKLKEYLKALKDSPELVVVTMSGKEGHQAVEMAYCQKPEIARFWLSDDAGYVTESYNLECTWFAVKPLTEEILAKALTRYIQSRNPTA